MGAYNAEKDIEKSINSILNQTYNNWEFIICDDCSKDSTYSILMKFSQQDPRIKVIQNNKNLGLGASLNECLKIATGDYLARQDADDTSVPKRLETQLLYILQNPNIDILGTSASLCDENMTVWGKRKMQNNFSLYSWAKGSQIIHASILAKTETYRKLGGYNPAAIRLEDYELWLRAIAIDTTFFNMPDILYNIQSSPNDYLRKRRIDRLNEIKLKLKFFKKYNFPLKSYIFILKSIILIMIPPYFLYCYHKLTSKE